jgi:hypothetical protein
MEYRVLTIAIRDCNLKNVRDALDSTIGDKKLSEIRQLFGVSIHVSDYSEEFASVNEFLKRNNLEDETPFFNEFDIRPYGLQIDFKVTPSFEQLDILEPVVFLLGQQISLVLHANCIVLFQNLEIPVGLFSNGLLIEIFEKFNKNYFRNKIWYPKEVYLSSCHSPVA